MSTLGTCSPSLSAREGVNHIELRGGWFKLMSQNGEKLSEDPKSFGQSGRIAQLCRRTVDHPGASQSTTAPPTLFNRIDMHAYREIQSFGTLS